MKLILLNKKIIAFLLIFFFQITFAKNLYGGIEIGSKGVKITVIDVQNAKKADFEIVKFWTENVGIAKGISINGALAAEDIDKAIQAIILNYNKLINEYQIKKEQIFIVASSGVGMANNTNILANKVKDVTGKDLEVISAKLEAKLMFQGCIPPNKFSDGLLLDIGGGNTKGGYIDIYNSDKQIFFPLNFNFGTITYTEKINKTSSKSLEIPQFIETVFNNTTWLNNEMKQMYAQRELSLKKNNIYLSGGSVWAFYTLYNAFNPFEKADDENFLPFTLENVVFYNDVIQNNYTKFVDLAKNDPEVDRVLKTYSQKHLIATNTLLISILENANAKNKKLFFAKQGQIAWLLAYVSTTAKGIKPIY